MRAAARRAVGRAEAVAPAVAHDEAAFVAPLVGVRVGVADDVDGVAADIADLAPQSLRAAKAMTRGSKAADALYEACYEAAAYVEGVSAFIERRRPTFLDE